MRALDQEKALKEQAAVRRQKADDAARKLPALVADGMTKEAIASRLGMSPWWVAQACKRMGLKLQARGWEL